MLQMASIYQKNGYWDGLETCIFGTNIYSLRNFALIVSVHPNCARKACMERALSNKTTMIRQINDLGRCVTPIFLLKNHFLYRFSTLINEKMKKI